MRKKGKYVRKQCQTTTNQVRDERTGTHLGLAGSKEVGTAVLGLTGVCLCCTDHLPNR